MSKLHLRFEPLEPRYLLSISAFVNGDLANARTLAVSSIPASESRELSVTAVEERSDELPSPVVVETLDASPEVSPSVADISDVVKTEVEEVAKVKIAETSNQTRNIEPVVAIEPVVSRELTSDNVTTSSSDIATFESGSIVEKETVSAALDDDITSTRNTIKPISDERISFDEAQTKVTVKTSPTLVAVAEKDVAIKTYDADRSLDNNQQRSLSESDATEEVIEEGKPTTTDRETTDISSSDSADRQETGKDEIQEKTDAGTNGRELVAAHKAQLAVNTESDRTENAASANDSDIDPDAKLHQQMTEKAGLTTTSQTQSTVAASSSTETRQSSNRAEQENPFTMASDLVFSEEQSDSGGRSAASRFLSPTEGALLLVTIGKPLTRLAGGDSRTDVAGVDYGMPGARTTFDRTRRNRRKTNEARDRYQHRGDVRDLTWFPPEEFTTDLIAEPLELSQEQTGRQLAASETISPGLADMVLVSHPEVAEAEDRTKSPESRLRTIPFSTAWDGYTLVGATAVMTLSGTISVLAVDRHRRIRAQDRHVKLPVPAYKGRTLARV
ncbi:MAG: LEPR-XLL domain-containing protein [Pirellulales bacterium]|nr:LEPR-XLL domain-containing protein [Pirellulales bacterium]